MFACMYKTTFSNGTFCKSLVVIESSIAIMKFEVDERCIKQVFLELYFTMNTSTIPKCTVFPKHSSVLTGMMNESIQTLFLIIFYNYPV